MTHKEGGLCFGMWEAPPQRGRVVREVSRLNKALLVVLLDQSDRGGECGIARRANELLSALVLSCMKAEGFKDYLDVCVLGYHTRDDGSPVVAPALQGGLSQKTFVTVSDIAHCPSRLEKYEYFVRDEESGEIQVIAGESPLWVEPFARGRAPLAAALLRATLVVDSWIARNRNNFPPLVVNMTAGCFDGMDPRPYATKLMSRATSEGNVLVGHDILLGERRWLSASPDIAQSIATLFTVCSIVPDALRRRMCIWRGLFTDKDARCFAINGENSLALDLFLASLDGEDRCFPCLTDDQERFLESLHA